MNFRNMGKIIHGLRVVLALLLFILLPNFVVASQWDEYSEFINQFYYLDNQNFNNISCGVGVSTIKNSMAQMKAQLKPLEDKIKIIENLSDFRLNFNRSSGLKLNPPYFDVKIVSEGGITDRDKVETGIKMMKDGMQYQINGVSETIEGLFEGYVLPKKEDIKIKKIVKNKDGVQIVYEKDGNNITSIYSGNSLKSKLTSHDVEIKSEETFQKIGNKLIVKSASANMEQGLNTTNINMALEYQEIKSVVFPAKIVSKFKLIMQDLQQEGQSEISFINCTVD